MNHKTNASKLVSLYGVAETHALEGAIQELGKESLIFQMLFAGWLQGLCLQTNDAEVLAAYMARMNLGVKIPEANDLHAFAEDLNEALLPSENKKRPA